MARMVFLLSVISILSCRQRASCARAVAPPRSPARSAQMAGSTPHGGRPAHSHGRCAARDATAARSRAGGGAPDCARPHYRPFSRRGTRRAPGLRRSAAASASRKLSPAPWCRSPRPGSPPVAAIVPLERRAVGRSALGGQPLAPARPPRGGDLASAFGGHARAVTVTALAYKLARLIGPLHDRILRWSRRGWASKRGPKPPKAQTLSGPALRICAAYKGGGACRQCDGTYR